VISAGKLDRQITLQRKSFIKDEYGAETETWIDIATVWAQKLDMRGTERHTAQQTVAQLDTKFRIWNRRGLTPIDRISYAKKIYDVGGVLEIGIGEGLELHAKVINNGN
jgi:SPP1 family predicted phage head-tail adaptor